MNLDTMKMFFQNEKNKLIGIGVASCLITTAIITPIAYFGGQPKYKGVITPVSFDTMTSTGTHLADYGDLNVTEGKQGWGNEDNISYVIYDEPLTRNVIEIKNAIGFQALNVAETQAKEIEKDPNYELNIMNAQFGETKEGKPNYVNPKNNDEEANYELVAPINVYMRVPAPVSIFFKDNLMSKVGSVNQPTIWEKDWEVSKQKAGIYNQTNNLNNTHALQSYYEWVKENNYLADLVMAYTFFNWMLFDLAPNNLNANYPDAPTKASNPAKIKNKVFLGNVEQMLKNVLQVNSVDKENIDQDLYNQAKTIHISGTGTASPYIKAEIDAFNEFLNLNFVIDGVTNVDISIDLTDEGSSTAWYMPRKAIEFDANGDDNNDGKWLLKSNSINSFTPPGNAFLATQSRRSYYGSYTSDTTNDKSILGMSQWGYGYQSTNPEDSEWDYMEQPTAEKISSIDSESLFGSQTNGGNEIYKNEVPWNYVDETLNTEIALPLGFTATTDPLVFYTDNDITFKHNGETYKPTGITPIATKLIFENPSQEPNITWDFLYSNGFIDATILK